MKYFKRLKVYKASNVIVDDVNYKAFSYNWWQFAAIHKGYKIFNNTFYSVSTRGHQGKSRGILESPDFDSKVYYIKS